MENKQNKDLVMPMMEARGLRDEIAKMLADQYNDLSVKKQEEPTIQVEIKGGSFK